MLGSGVSVSRLQHSAEHGPDFLRDDGHRHHAHPDASRTQPRADRRAATNGRVDSHGLSRAGHGWLPGGKFWQERAARGGAVIARPLGTVSGHGGAQWNLAASADARSLAARSAGLWGRVRGTAVRNQSTRRVLWRAAGRTA